MLAYAESSLLLIASMMMVMLVTVTATNIIFTSRLGIIFGVAISIIVE